MTFTAVTCKTLGFIFGLGLVFSINNNPELNPWLVPDIGLWLMFSTLPFLLFNAVRTPTRHDTFIIIPVLITLLFTGLSMGSHYGLRFMNGSYLVGPSLLSPFLFAFICLSVYLVVKTNPHILELPFALMVVAVTAGITYSAFATHLKSSGFVSPMNYDIAPILIIGCLLSPRQWRWWLSGVSTIGLLLSGSEIGLVAFVVVVVVIIIRRDLSKKILQPVAALLACFAVSIPTGVFHDIWVHNGLQKTLGNRIDALMAWYNGGSFKELDYLLTGNRLLGEWVSIRPVTLFGHGYDTGINPANQSLIMADQIGVIGALAWVVATVGWGIRYKNYYLLPVILVVGTLDVFFWRMGLLWWWALIAISETDSPIYRRKKPDTIEEKIVRKPTTIPMLNK